MRKMSTAAFIRAEGFIFEHGRKLDQMTFEYHFGAGRADQVLEALAAYQNADGGFGHGLEPDLRASVSSAIATTHGLEILRDVSAPDSERMVQRAITYLLDTYEAESGIWPIIPAQVEEAPHAPWWGYAESSKNFGAFLLNPRAAIVGYLWDYAELVPNTLLEEVTQSVLSTMTGLGGEIGMHDLFCLIVLAESKNLPSLYGVELTAKLAQSVGAAVEADAGQWSSYGLKPLDVAPTPHGCVSGAVARKDIEANLDYLLETQLDDGSWPLSWSWAQIDEEAWRQAEQDWKGYLAVRNLRTLRAYGRIDDE